MYVGVQKDKGPLLRVLTTHLVVRRTAPYSLNCLAEGQGEAEEVIDEITKNVPPGCTGADCKALCNTACLLATRERIRFAKSLESELSVDGTASVSKSDRGEMIRLYR